MFRGIEKNLEITKNNTSSEMESIRERRKLELKIESWI